MMKYMRKAKGSISIFLLLVLMPMVTYATLVIDISRIQATRTLIMGAGDLSMNAGMSEYELALQNMYGLFAQVNNEADLEKALKQYFTETITGAVKKSGETTSPTDEKYIQDWADALAGYITQSEDINEDELVNFLEMQVVNYSAKTVDGTALANPAVMKKQIIDYMKYKGPVSIASNLADKLSFFGGAAKQTAAIEKKVEYTEELDKLNDPCKEAYKAIMGTTEKKDHEALMADDMFNKTANEIGYYQYVNKYNGSLGGFDYTNWNDKEFRFDQILRTVVPDDYKYSSQARIAIAKNPIPSDKQWNLEKWIEEAKNTTLGNLKSQHGFTDVTDEEKSTLQKAAQKLDSNHDIANDIVKPEKDSRITSIGDYEKLVGDLYYSNRPEVDSSQQDLDKTNPTNSNFQLKIGQMTIPQSLYQKSENSNRIIKIDTDKSDGIANAIQTRYNHQKEYADSISYSGTEDNAKLYKLVAYSLLYESVCNQYESLYNVVIGQIDQYEQSLNQRAKEKAIDDYISKILDCRSSEQVKNNYKKLNKTERIEVTVTEIDDDGNEKTSTSKQKVNVEEALYIKYHKETDSEKKNQLKNKFKSENVDSLWNKLNESEKENYKEEAGNELFREDGITKGTNYAQFKDYKSKYKEDSNYKTNVDNSKNVSEFMANTFVGRRNNSDSYFNRYIKAMYGNDVLPEIADYYERHAWASLFYTYYYVYRSEVAATTVCNKLQGVINQANYAEAKKKQWNNQINAIDDASTKANMQADLNTTTNGLNIDEINQLKTVAEKSKTHFHDLKVEFEKLTFLDTKLFGGTINASHSGIHIKEKDLPSFVSSLTAGTIDVTVDGWAKRFANNNAYNTVTVNESLLVVADNIVVSKWGNTKSLENLLKVDQDGKNGYGGRMTDLNAIGLDDEKIDNEVFFITLDNIVHPQTSEMTSETQETVKTVKSVSEVKDGKADINKAAKDNGTQPKDVEKKDDGGKKEETKEKVKFENGNDKDGNPIDTLKEIQNYSASRNTGKNDTLGTYEVTNIGVNTDKGADYKGSSSNAKNSLNTSTSLLTNVGNLAGDLLTDARDCIYLEEYFTEMFTCQCDPVLIHKKNSDWCLLNGFEADDINQETEWFGKEVEYLLWGDKNIDGNIVKTNVMLYTIRFAMNTIYCFTAADIQAFANEVATAIAGWSVIGVPIVSVCITLAIAAAESAYDLEELTQGRDVPIYKNQATFVCSPTGLLKTVAVKATGKAIETVSSYAEDKLNEGLDKISESFDKGLDGAEEETEKLVESYLVSKEEDILTEIENKIGTPIINSVNDIVAKAKSNRDKLHEYTEEAITNAFDQIRNDFNSLNSEDGNLIAEYGLQVLNDDLKSNIITTVEDYVNKVLDNEKISDKEHIRVTLVGRKFDESKYPNLSEEDKNLLKATQQDKDDGVITKAVDAIRKQIEEKISEKSKAVASKIKEAKNNGVKNIKQYAHDEIDKATQSLTNKATNAVDKAMDGAIEKFAKSSVAKTVDGSGSGSVNMNYKEYCKVFILLQLIAGGETKLLQRAGVLMQYNVQNAKENANKDFKLTQADTLIYVSADVKLGTIMSWPFMVNSDETTGTSSVEGDLSHLGQNYVTIHYEGYNGY